MKKLVFVLFFTIAQVLPLKSFAQKLKDFEGVITYKIEYYTRTGKLITGTNINNTRYLGDTVIIYIRKGDDYQIYTNSYIKNDLYTCKKNRSYLTLNLKSHDTIIVSDLANQRGDIFSWGKKDSTINVLGYPCKEYYISTSVGENIFFYCDSLYKNPKYFINYKDMGYNHFAIDAKSVYLKMITYTSMEEYLVFTAIKIERNKIKRSMFKVPSKSKRYLLHGKKGY